MDTNVILQHLVQDESRYAKTATRLFEDCDRGEIGLVILPEVLAECVFVLESFYKKPRSAISTVLQTLVKFPGIELDSLSLYLDALDRFAASNIHFVDCVIAATAAKNGVSVATFDGDFGKIRDINVDIS